MTSPEAPYAERVGAGQATTTSLSAAEATPRSAAMRPARRTSERGGRSTTASATLGAATTTRSATAPARSSRRGRAERLVRFAGRQRESLLQARGP